MGEQVRRRLRLLSRRFTKPVTARDVALQEAALVGLDITPDEADVALWEFTGFPEFWPRGFATPEDAMRHQLRSCFTGVVSCARCGKEAKEATGAGLLCAECAEALEGAR